MGNTTREHRFQGLKFLCNFTLTPLPRGGTNFCDCGDKRLDRSPTENIEILII